MAPRLTDHLTKKLNNYQLLDPSLRPAPETHNPWAVFCGWSLDWMLAFTVSHLAITAWVEFFMPLGWSSMSAESRQVMAGYGAGVKLLLAPLFFFAFNFLGIAFNGMTLGLKLFKHRVEAPDARTTLLWSMGATVSAAVLGLPLLNSWLDQLAGSETLSAHHYHWRFTQVTEVEHDVPDLVQQALDNAAVPHWDEKIAA